MTMLTHLPDRAFTSIPVYSQHANDNADKPYISPYLLKPHVTLDDAMFQRFLDTIEGKVT